MSSVALITGAAGFAGSHLLDLLAADGVRLVAWHRPGKPQPTSGPPATWDAVDMLDAAAVRAAIERARPSIVYHCAAAAHVGRAWDAAASTLAANVLGTHHLIDALLRAGTRTRVLIPSSAMVYRPSNEPLAEDDPLAPSSPYGLSKLAQEMLGWGPSDGRLAVTIARAFNHVGPRQSPSFVASSFARQLALIELGRAEPEIVVGNLTARREALDVRDTVRAYRTILERGEPGRAYNVAAGEPLEIGELLEMLCSRARTKVRVRVDPSLFRPHDVPVVAGNPGRIRTELGWTPAIPLSKTVDDLLDYWRHVAAS